MGGNTRDGSTPFSRITKTPASRGFSAFSRDFRSIALDGWCASRCASPTSTSLPRLRRGGLRSTERQGDRLSRQDRHSILIVPQENSNIIDTCFAVLAFGGEAPRFLGTSFVVSADGGLLTCRHVAESIRDGEHLAVLHVDNAGERRESLIIPEEVLFPDDDGLDLAYLPKAANVIKSRVAWPLGEQSWILMSIEAHTFGYTAGGNPFPVEVGYHSGSVVARRNSDPNLGGFPSLVLSFPVLEGMSGSPLLSAESPNLSRRVIGICCGNESHRIVAREVVSTEIDGREVREQVQRLVEQGLALPLWTILDFLQEIGVELANP